MKDFAKTLANKFTSRKFLVSAAGILSGIVLVAVGNDAEGIATIIASVLGYLASEGLVDALAVFKKTDKVVDALEEPEVKEDDT